ncbi:MAG: hypothetical protein AAF542_04085 [Pseudomonadota bacterium]
MNNKASRALLAGPLVLLSSIALMLGMALWLPAGAANLNNIAFPLFLFPLLWTGLFFYALLDTKLKRAYIIVCLVLVANMAIIASAFIA